MIRVTIYHEDNKITGFSCVGHAGYADSGKDIICAGVSALVINAVNSLDALTDADISVKEHDGCVRCQLNGPSDEKAQLLLASLQLGLLSLEESYGSPYIKVTLL